MTREEARRRAVEAAAKGVCDSLDGCGNRPCDYFGGERPATCKRWRDYQHEADAAIAAYERAMADAGWRMVRVGTDEWDIPGEFGEGWNACRRAMLGDDE